MPFSRGVWECLGGAIFPGRTKPCVLTLETGAKGGSPPLPENAEVFVYCLRGQLECQIGSASYDLKQGDSLLFFSKLPHRWRNPGPHVTSLLMVFGNAMQD